MNSHFEKWINPNSKKEEEIEVREYLIDDFEAGLIPRELRLGKRLKFDPIEQRQYYALLKKEESLKIEEGRKKIYFEKVELEIQKYISCFEKRHAQSENKERLILTEINSYEKLLFPEKLNIPYRSDTLLLLNLIRPYSGNTDFSKLLSDDGKTVNPGWKPESKVECRSTEIDSTTIGRIRDLYQKLIVNGLKDYSLTDSPKCQRYPKDRDHSYIEVEAISRYYNYLKNIRVSSPQPKQRGHQQSPEIKTLINSEQIQAVFEILKVFFDKKEHDELKSILGTGKNATKPLLFRDHGNRIADVFKKLMEHEFIPGWNKKKLQSWIMKNFTYQHNGKVKSFTEDYIEKCISRNYYPCKSPLIEIIKGEIFKATNPKIKKHNKY